MQSCQDNTTEQKQLDGTILIADDDRWLNTVLEVRCTKLGLTVLAVEDAMTALSSAEFAMPDLVVLDVEMPGGNGLAACEMMSSDPQMSHIPVIILTGRTDPETVRRCQTLGAHYVQKGTDAWSRIEPIIRHELGQAAASSLGFPRAH